MTISVTSSASTLGSHIRILNTSQPILTALRRHHPVYSPGLPPNHLLSLLPTSILLKLRQMSHATRAWIDTAETPVFARLCIAYPLERYPINALSTLNNIALECRHLTVSFTNNDYGEDAKPTTLGGATLPSMPCLTGLRLLCPSFDVFYPLLSFRLAIQSQDLQHLTHLEISNLNFKGILALRWGSFSSYGVSDSAGSKMWHRLKSIDIKMLPCSISAGNTRYFEGETLEQKSKRLEKEKEDRRTGIKVLHDWLKSFASTNNLKTLKFEWKGQDGPNPLLLDLKATEGSKETWFSAPKIDWKALKEVHLRGIEVTEADMAELRKRMKDLLTLIAQPGRLSPAINARDVVIDNRKSMEVILGKPCSGTTGQIDDLRGLVALDYAVGSLVDPPALASNTAVEAQDKLAELPREFVINVESLRSSATTGLTDSSREVPLMLDMDAEKAGFF